MKKIIAFDLDGTLIDGDGTWVEMHRLLKTEEISKENGKLFYANKISYEEWMKRDVELWKGADAKVIQKLKEKISLMPGIEVINHLDKKYILAIISGGLMDIAIDINKKFGNKFKYCYANELIIKDGKISGAKMNVSFENKGEILKNIAKKEKVPLENCIAIGDYLNDIPMFKVAGFSIAFNPKFPDVAKNANVAIYEKNLIKILEYL
ncbi:MAG: HAD family hydrolase [Candidatus Altarchaeaceae archaeon]